MYTETNSQDITEMSETQAKVFIECITQNKRHNTEPTRPCSKCEYHNTNACPCTTKDIMHLLKIALKTNKNI